MKPKEYDTASQLTKDVFDIVSAYNMAEILSGNNKNIKVNLVNQPLAGDVEAVSGTNYKFNIFDDYFEMVFYVRVTGYAGLDIYKNLFTRLELRFEDKTKSVGYNTFEGKFVLKFAGKPEPEVMMDLFKNLAIA